VIGVLACGCGGKAPAGVASLGSTTATSGVASATQTAGNSGDAVTAQLKFAQCMQSHGEPDYPEPGGNAEANAKSMLKLGPSSPHFLAAEKACKQLLPEGEQASPGEQARVEAEALKFANCMRTHGMANWPDPSSNGVGYMVAPAGAAATSPAYLKASKACKQLLPSG